MAAADPQAAAVERVRVRTGADATGRLVADVSAVIAAGLPHAHDALTTATALWVAMRGLVLLRRHRPRVPLAQRRPTRHHTDRPQRTP